MLKTNRSHYYVVLINKAGHPIPFVGGIERYTFELFKIFCKKHLRVLLISKFLFRKNVYDLNCSRIINAKLPLWRIAKEGTFLWLIHYIVGTFFYCLKAFLAVLECGARIVHVNDGFSSLLMSIFSKLTRKKFYVVATIHAPPPWIVSYGLNSILVKIAYILLYLPGIKQADRIISVNPFICHALSRYKDYCVFIPNAVSQDFCKYEHEINSILRYYGIKNKYFLFISRLVKEKGIDKLVRVIRYYREIGGKSQVVIIGSGPLERYIKKLTNIDQNIIHLKYIPREHLKVMYKNALALLVTSYAEGLPTTVLESLACGTPVILFSDKTVVDSINTALSIKDSDNRGVLVVFSEKDMATIMYKIENNSIKSARNYPVITWNDVIIKLIKVYRNVIFS